MAEPTLIETFGAGAAQTSSALTIQKAPMNEFGLTAGAANTAESLFAGTVAVASKNLTEANRALDRVNRNVTVTPAGFDVVEDPPGSGNYFRRDIYTVILYKSEPATALALDNY